MRIKMLPLLFLPPFLFLSSCKNAGLLPVLTRDSSDLETAAAPRVESFKKPLSISISWDADPRAESYLLEYRSLGSGAAGSGSSGWQELYRGGLLGCELKGSADSTFYRFRITKLWEGRSFGPSASGLGMMSSVTGDVYEPNDSEDSAVDIGCAKEANIYYYRAADGSELADVDWYSIKVPPRMRAALLVNQLNNLDSSNIVWLSFQQKGSLSINFSNNQDLYISNFDYTEKTLYFRLFPRPEYFIVGGGAGGSVIRYTVTLHDIAAL